jgi:hypothetical protein
MFITKADIEEFIPLAVNLDSKRLELFASQQEKIKCTEFLGRELYEDLKQTESPENDALLEQVKPMLAYWTYVMYLKQGKVFNTATGPAIKRSDASIPLTDIEMDRVIKANCDVARFYESELEVFLKENIEDYPLWKHSRLHTGCATFGIKKTCNDREI